MCHNTFLFVALFAICKPIRLAAGNSDNSGENTTTKMNPSESRALDLIAIQRAAIKLGMLLPKLLTSKVRTIRL